jgi:ubiquinone/menaquinone biosynthesis C-methylase UbiE
MGNVLSYYNQFDERNRLSENLGKIEFIRTKNIIKRYLKSPPAVVLDVGGAAGRYSSWLAKEGYQVHLIDPVPLHVQQAQAVSDAQPATPIINCQVGDARQLEFDNALADAVLELGPLYHLVDLEDRRRSLSEAYRVLKTGGFLFAAGISRFASTINGLTSGYFQDPEFREIMTRDLETGQHRNPTGNTAYFTDTFFHHPDELKTEVASVGFEIVGLIAVEGISYMMVDLDRHWENQNHREFLLKIITELETEDALIGASPHFICVAMKP